MFPDVGMFPEVLRRECPNGGNGSRGRHPFVGKTGFSQASKIRFPPAFGFGKLTVVPGIPQIRPPIRSGQDR